MGRRRGAERTERDKRENRKRERERERRGERERERERRERERRERERRERGSYFPNRLGLVNLSYCVDRDTCHLYVLPKAHKLASLSETGA